MVTSQNGWAASADRRAIGVQAFTVHGVGFPGGVKIGDVAVVLGLVVNRFRLEVEPLVAGWCWGWNYRPVTGGALLSNHASGTAVDVNAPAHQYGKRNTFTPDQRDTIRAILASVNGVVRWGGDYTRTPDDMHFEINGGRDAVARVAELIRGQRPTPTPTPASRKVDIMVRLQRGDSTVLDPAGVEWGRRVYLVKYDPQLPGGCIRLHMPDPRAAVYVGALAAQGGTVDIINQGALDAIPEARNP
jgi:hypothetical protein